MKTVPQGDSLIASWTPEPYHAAFSDFASGGIISVLLDCLGNWTGAYTLMQSRRSSTPPGTVTSEYAVKFHKPTPVNSAWDLRAWPLRNEDPKVWVEGELKVGEVKTASMSGLFVAVPPDHPAFHRWQ